LGCFNTGFKYAQYAQYTKMQRSDIKTVKSEAEIIQESDPKIESFLDRKFRHSRSFSTRKTYKSALNKFVEFRDVKLNLHSTDHLLTPIKNKQLDPIDVLDDYFTYLSDYEKPKTKGHLSSRCISHYLTVAKEFLNAYGCKIYNEDVKQRFRTPKISNVYEEGLTKEQILRILRNSFPDLGDVILTICASGMRIAEVMQLKKTDVDFEKKPTTIQLRAITTKSRQSRTVYLTREATKALKDLLKRRDTKVQDYDSNEYIILERKEGRDLNTEKGYANAVHAAVQNYEKMLAGTRKRLPDLAKKLENGRNAIHFHSFRYWFKTQASLANQGDFAEMIMGHKDLAKTYIHYDKKTSAKTYLSIEHALTVADLERIERDLEKINDKQTELDEKIRRYDKYCKIMDRIPQEKLERLLLSN